MSCRSVCQAAGHVRLRFCSVAGSVAASKLGCGAYRPGLFLHPRDQCSPEDALAAALHALHVSDLSAGYDKSHHPILPGVHVAP